MALLRYCICWGFAVTWGLESFRHLVLCVLGLCDTSKNYGLSEVVSLKIKFRKGLPYPAETALPVTTQQFWSINEQLGQEFLHLESARLVKIAVEVETTLCLGAGYLPARRSQRGRTRSLLVLACTGPCCALLCVLGACSSCRMPCTEERTRLPPGMQTLLQGRKCLSSNALQWSFAKTYFQSGFLEAFFFFCLLLTEPGDFGNASAYVIYLSCCFPQAAWKGFINTTPFSAQVQQKWAGISLLFQ